MAWIPGEGVKQPKLTLAPVEILEWMTVDIEERTGNPELYDGPMGAILKNNQMAQKVFRVGDELVRINISVAYLPPSEHTPNLDLFEE